MYAMWPSQIKCQVKCRHVYIGKELNTNDTIVYWNRKRKTTVIKSKICRCVIKTLVRKTRKAKYLIYRLCFIEPLEKTENSIKSWSLVILTNELRTFLFSSVDASERKANSSWDENSRSSEIERAVVVSVSVKQMT